MSESKGPWDTPVVTWGMKDMPAGWAVVGYCDCAEPHYWAYAAIDRVYALRWSGNRKDISANILPSRSYAIP